MHDSVHDNQASEQAQPPGDATPGSSLLQDIGRLAHAVRSLFGAQLTLLAAELGLARSAVSWILVAALAATITGVGLGLTLLCLAGVALAQALGSWLWALAVLAVLEAAALLGAIVLFRRCMHWMSLPATRQEWRAIMRDTLHRAERDIKAGKGEVPP